MIRDGVARIAARNADLNAFITVAPERTLAEARVPFEFPPDIERTPRLASVLAVIYLIFNEGYTATAGDDWMRPALCDEALRLDRNRTDICTALAVSQGGDVWVAGRHVVEARQVLLASAHADLMPSVGAWQNRCRQILLTSGAS